jgi:hypothetical protein
MILIEKLSFKIFPHSFVKIYSIAFNVSLILCDLTFLLIVFSIFNTAT